jgi:hypothetical protein
VQFFCGHYRKSLGQIEAHLIPECRNCSCPSAVLFTGSVVQNMRQKVVILLHEMRVVLHVEFTQFVAVL